MSARDWVAEMFGDAVADVRSKLIDEAFFGRRAPEHAGHNRPGTPNDLNWSVEIDVSVSGGTPERGPAPEPEPSPLEQDRGIDR